MLFANIGFAEIIPASNRVDWVVSSTVGMQQPIPTRTTLLDVTAAPYNAPNTGSADASAGIQAAIDAASSNEVVYLPDGRYRLDSVLTINKSYITLRSQSTNAVLIGNHGGSYVLKVGHDAMGVDEFRTYSVTNGMAKGSTNLFLTSALNRHGDTIKAGDLVSISTQTRNRGTDHFPIISAVNFDRIISQVVAIHARNNNTVSITAPLVWDFTNAPVLQEVDTLSQPLRMVGIENLSITLTNTVTGATGTSGYMIDATGLRDCWFTNLNLGYAYNYQLYLRDSLNCNVVGSTIHDTLTIGTSHAGLIMARVSGVLVENNIFTSKPGGLQLFPAIEVNDGVMGTAIAFNYFTNCASDIHTHNTHPMMNLVEGNVCFSFFQMDGYFGSASHYTLFRNRLINTVVLKKFTSQMQIVGNVIGSTNYNYVFSKEQSGYSSPYPLFEMGYPHISNSGYEFVTPPRPWNFPGTYLDAFDAFNEGVNGYSNGLFTFTGSYGPTNRIWPSMGTGTLTNIPRGINAGYAMVFQDAGNTNFYYSGTNAGALTSIDGWDGTSVTMSNDQGYIWFYVTNGARLFIAGQNSYNQLQSSNKYTHLIHGNILYTNGIGQAPTLAWDTVTADKVILASLLYPSGAPSWWGTNRWPAIDTNAPYATPIPAEDRFNGIASGGEVAAGITAKRGAGRAKGSSSGGRRIIE